MSCNSCACHANSNYFRIPPRGPWSELGALGIRRTCESDQFSVQVDCPPNWSIQKSSVSPYHEHLVDAEGKPVLCLLHKGGSGGSGSFQISSPENCADL